jgi:hypothetical protein
MNNAAFLWVLIPTHETGTGIGHSFHWETTSTGHGLFREESKMESPNRGMSGGAAHQAGSWGVTVPDVMHPRPTFNMGWDEGGVLSLIQSQEV